MNHHANHPNHPAPTSSARVEDELALALRWRTGDRLAGLELVTRHRARVYRRLRAAAALPHFAEVFARTLAELAELERYPSFEAVVEAQLDRVLRDRGARVGAGRIGPLADTVGLE